VQESRAGRVRDGLSHAGLDPDPVDLAHREDLRVELAQELPLSVVERADADQRELSRLDRRQRPAVALERIARQPERGSEHHPVDVARRRGRRSVQVAVRVDPDDTARAADLGHPDEGAQRDRVVAAEDERQRSPFRRLHHQRRQAVAEVEDLCEIARVRVSHRGRLDDRRDDVARVGDPDVQLLRESLVEARIADRGRAHVHAAPPRAEVERSPDHSNLARGLVDGHG